ncbi:hypothetical protein QG37_04233 [Candidozyma auris]|nr:hypothetical protein QG37_04233 [[Candida] auris]
MPLWEHTEHSRSGNILAKFRETPTHYGKQKLVIFFSALSTIPWNLGPAGAKKRSELWLQTSSHGKTLQGHFEPATLPQIT